MSGGAVTTASGLDRSSPEGGMAAAIFEAFGQDVVPLIKT
jgi:hypothetical protein